MGVGEDGAGGKEKGGVSLEGGLADEEFGRQIVAIDCGGFSLGGFLAARNFKQGRRCSKEVFCFYIESMFSIMSITFLLNGSFRSKQAFSF